MEHAIKELEKLETSFMHFQDQTAVREEHFRGVDAEREGEMRRYELAYSNAVDQIHQSIDVLKH